MGLPRGASGKVEKNLPANAGDMVRGSPGGGLGNPLQYSWLENPMDRGAWRATVHGVAESGTTERLTHTLELAFSGKRK